MQSAATALEGFTRSKPAAPGLARRLLALAGDEPAASAERNLRAFQLLVLLHLAVERAHSAIALAARGGSAGHTLLAAGIALVCAASLLAWRKPATARTATFAALAAQLVFVSVAFPHNANHDLLVVLALGLVALLDLRRAEQREVLLQSLRWMTLIILFTTGFQKLLHGTYFFGEYLAVRVAHSDSFAALFQYALPEAEFLRLRSLGENPGVAGAALFLGSASGALPEAGTGPYRVHSPLFLVLANGVWVFEMLVPLLLMIRRTRVWATLATLAFLGALQLGAREFFFLGIFANCMLLFLPGGNLKARTAFAVFYSAVLLRTLWQARLWLLS